MTRADDLAALKQQAKEAKELGKSHIAVPINLLLALEVKK
jgi:hypothetical protein